MSDKFENELVSLLEMRYSDNPFNHPNMYSNFFELNKEELKDPSVWHEIKNLASEELDYKIKCGLPNLVAEFFDELQMSYDIWSRKINNL